MMSMQSKKRPIISKCVGVLLFSMGGICHGGDLKSVYFSKTLDFTKAVDTVVMDFNKDGRDDILICGHDRNDKILYSGPNGYSYDKGTVLPSLWNDRHGCDAADVNKDGFLDIYCMNGALYGTRTKANELYMGGAGESFTLRKDGFGAEDPTGRGRFPVFFNFNNDGYPDLYITNYSVPRSDSLPNANRVYVNAADGTGNFVEKTTQATGPFGSKCARKGDWNKDGYDDILLCNHDNPGFKPAPGKLFQNDAVGGFQDATALIYTGDAIWRDAILNDLDKDGYEDLVVITKKNVLEVRLNRKKGVLFGSTDFSAKLNANAGRLTVVDMNGDGFKDIYVVRYSCQDNYDKASDALFLGPGWQTIEIPQLNPGCGHLAASVDNDKVLLLNGDWGQAGTNELVGTMEAFSKVFSLQLLSQ